MLDAIHVNNPDKLRHAYALLTNEIDRVWSLIYARTLRDEQTPIVHHMQQVNRDPDKPT